MAQHNPQSRTFLVVFLVATVICFAAAKVILSGLHDKPHAAAHHGGSHTTEASEASHNQSSSANEREPHTQTGSPAAPSNETLDEAKP